MVPGLCSATGLSQPAGAWQLGMVPALTAAGYRVVTFDNRGVAPSSSPPAPYTVDDMVQDTVGLLDHLGLSTVCIAGYSMGGPIAQLLWRRHPEVVEGLVLCAQMGGGPGIAYATKALAAYDELAG